MHGQQNVKIFLSYLLVGAEKHAAQRAGLKLIPLHVKKWTNSEVKKSENINC